MPEAPQPRPQAAPNPLNQAVLPLLQQAQVRLKPGVSPLVQLMQWSLENGHDQQYDHLRARQGEILRTLEGWPEADVQQFLTRSQDDPESADLLTPADLKGLSPPQASRVLLSLLHDQLQSVDPLYPPPQPGSQSVPSET